MAEKKKETKAGKLAAAVKPAIKVIKKTPEPEPEPKVAKAKPLSFGVVKSAVDPNQAYDLSLITPLEAERRKCSSE